MNQWLDFEPKSVFNGAMREKNTKSLDGVLASVANVLFPNSLEKAPIQINSRNEEGDTPLHILVHRNDVEGVRILIDAGADINAIGDMGETPLHIAIGNKNTEITKSLIKAGAKTDIRSEFGWTAAEVIAE